MRRGFRAANALAAALALTLSGCALLGLGGAKPAAMDVQITAAGRVNPDETGQPLPTVFRLYLLGSAAKAEAAAYEDLYRGAEALGEDVLAADELVLSPGETARKRIAADKPARALLVVGIFRRPSGTSWRAIVPIAKGRPRAVSLRAEDYRVERQ
jgi:type VI secretion system protein VasD